MSKINSVDDKPEGTTEDPEGAGAEPREKKRFYKIKLL